MEENKEVDDLKKLIQHDCAALREAMYSKVTGNTSTVISEKYKSMDEHVAQLELLIGKNTANTFAASVFATPVYENCIA